MPCDLSNQTPLPAQPFFELFNSKHAHLSQMRSIDSFTGMTPTRKCFAQGMQKSIFALLLYLCTSVRPQESDIEGKLLQTSAVYKYICHFCQNDYTDYLTRPINLRVPQQIKNYLLGLKHTWVSTVQILLIKAVFYYLPRIQCFQWQNEAS